MAHCRAARAYSTDSPLARDFPAVVLRQLNIQHHQVGPLAAQDAQCLLAIIRGEDSKSRILQIRLNETDNLFVIVHHQNALGHRNIIPDQISRDEAFGQYSVELPRTLKVRGNFPSVPLLRERE